MSQRDFKEQLRRQLGFLDRSAALYDAGHHDEAIRIATSIRVLIHDTGGSTSVLTHLDAKGIRLLTTQIPFPVEMIHPEARGMMLAVFGGMVMLTSREERAAVPQLDNARRRAEVTVDEWWAQPVTGGGVHPISRGVLVLHAANKDGGAHVDKALDPKYEALISTHLHHRPSADAEPEAQGGLHLIALRQFAYELLNSPELLALAKA